MPHVTQSDIAAALAGGCTQAQAYAFALEMAWERHDAEIIRAWEKGIGKPLA